MEGVSFGGICVVVVDYMRLSEERSICFFKGNFFMV